jgi:acetyltransferase
MATIVELSATEATTYLSDLVDVLRDAVDNGSSVGFLPPLSEKDAGAYWLRVIETIGKTRVLLAAKQDNAVVGVVMLEFASMPNGRHRAEVQKLLVHSKARRQGIATALMSEIENAARQHSKSLLVLDTCRGYSAEQLYKKLGWREAGEIPKFALEPDGFCDTVIFYKQL